MAMRAAGWGQVMAEMRVAWQWDDAVSEQRRDNEQQSNADFKSIWLRFSFR